jgi:apolipoprotein N-acyltransferase
MRHLGKIVIAPMPDLAQKPAPLTTTERAPGKRLNLSTALVWAASAAAAFHLAYTVPGLSVLMFVYLIGLVQLSRVETSRQAFYLGLSVGLLTAGPQLACFWKIFGPGAFALWLVVAFWIGLFVVLTHQCQCRFKTPFWAVLVPFLWTGLEYFRSELYFLRFSWLNVGYAFSDSAALPIFHGAGMYGVGFLGTAAAVTAALLPFRRAARFGLRLALFVIVILFLQAYGMFERTAPPQGQSVVAAGVQLEFPTDAQVLSALNRLVEVEPQADLLVLSEYTFDGPVPERVLTWCREHHRYLVVGGKDPAANANFYDTAFVVGPTGEIVFRQAKSVPIQFFKDGLPARDQKLWDSPWGKIGICICYDLSYVRVTDRLIRLGAQALVIPTMDVEDWGRREHELHACVAPIRSAEYGVPIFRVASSGISQWTDRHGQALAKAGFPGQQAIISGHLTLVGTGSLPLDRWLAPFSAVVSGVMVLYFLIHAFSRKSFSAATK